MRWAVVSSAAKSRLWARCTGIPFARVSQQSFALSSTTKRSSGRATATIRASRKPPVFSQQSTKSKGDALELRVARLLVKSGAWRVRHNVTLRDSHGNLSQVDVVSGLLFRTYYECKNYATRYPVGLHDVAKFKSVLELNGIPAARGVVVTTSRFSPRCAKIGITCIDGEGLHEWERRVSRVRVLRWLGWICGLLAVLIAALEGAPELAAALRGSALDSALIRAGGPSLASVLMRVHETWLRWRVRVLPIKDQPYNQEDA